MKTLDKVGIYPCGNTEISEVITKNGITRISRWIKIQCNYNPSKNNHLWDYVTDENGNHPCNEKFDRSCLYLDYFKYGGKTYALNQFIRIGGIADCIGHSIGYIENGKKFYLSGYDGENYYYPLYVELDSCGEKVRLYREV